MKRNLVVENDPALSEPLAALKAEWADAIEREEFARQAIVNLAAQIKELEACIADARLRSVAPIPIAAGIQGITEHSMKKRAALDEVECLLEAKQELLKQLARLESEFRGFELLKSGVRESIWRLFYNDLIQKYRPIFARVSALGTQIGLTESMIASELLNGCNDNLTDLTNELGLI